MPRGRKGQGTERLRADLATLLERTDVGTRREFGKSLGWKTGEEMVRLYLDGDTEISLEKAAGWARRCGAELRAVPNERPLVALEQVITALPERHADLKRRLLALLRDEREGGRSLSPKRRAG